MAPRLFLKLTMSSSSSGSSSLGSFAFPLAIVLGARGGRDGQRGPGVVKCHEILAGGALKSCWRQSGVSDFDSSLLTFLGYSSKKGVLHHGFPGVWPPQHPTQCIKSCWQY